jgi:hypothetical protein
VKSAVPLLYVGDIFTDDPRVREISANVSKKWIYPFACNGVNIKVQEDHVAQMHTWI